MRFITEEDLRALYRKEAFTDYCILDGTRLTPGGRQYLADRKIKVILKEQKSQIDEDSKTSQQNLMDSLQIRELKVKMDSVESVFLMVEQELLAEDILTAQKIMELRKQFTCIKNAIVTKHFEQNLDFLDCQGMKKEQITQISCYEDCFPIEEIHVQLKNGKQIVQLHRLRCVLKELYISALKLEPEYKTELPFKEIKEEMNKLIHTISQLICTEVGVTKCQRKGPK